MDAFRTTPFALVLLLALGVSACIGRDRSVEPRTPADDSYDQEGWANTSPVGPGSETSSSFYGVGASPSATQHRPASPRVAGGHHPY